jgi:hypothetical protein
MRGCPLRGGNERSKGDPPKRGDEAEEILAKVTTAIGQILAQACTEAMEILATACQKIPLTVGPPNLALAREEARRATQFLLDQPKTDTDGLLANAQQRLE